MSTVYTCDECKQPMLSRDTRWCWGCDARLCKSCDYSRHWCDAKGS